MHCQLSPARSSVILVCRPHSGGDRANCQMIMQMLDAATLRHATPCLNTTTTYDVRCGYALVCRSTIHLEVECSPFSHSLSPKEPLLHLTPCLLPHANLNPRQQAGSCSVAYSNTHNITSNFSQSPTRQHPSKMSSETRFSPFGDAGATP